MTIEKKIIVPKRWDIIVNIWKVINKKLLRNISFFDWLTFIKLLKKMSVNVLKKNNKEYTRSSCEYLIKKIFELIKNITSK